MYASFTCSNIFDHLARWRLSSDVHMSNFSMSNDPMINIDVGNVPMSKKMSHAAMNHEWAESIHSALTEGTHRGFCI
jgi:hypothetical protein